MTAVDYKKRNREAIFSALADLGIEMVHVEYDGSGDSGQIESVSTFSDNVPSDVKLDEKIAFAEVRVATYRMTEAGLVAETTVTEKEFALRDAIEEFCYAVLEEDFGGWEIDDGACGEFTFDVSSQTVTCVHNARYTAYETSRLSRS